MKSKYFKTATLLIAALGLFNEPANALEKVSGAFLGATPAQLLSERFVRATERLSVPGTLYFTKETSQRTSISVFTGQEDQPDSAAYSIYIFKSFKVNEGDKCSKFLSELYIYLTSTEKSKITSMDKPPIIIGSGLKEFGGTVVNEAYKFDSENRTIHFYCKIFKGQSGETERIDAHMILRDDALFSRATAFKMQQEALHNPLLQDIIR